MSAAPARALAPRTAAPRPPVPRTTAQSALFEVEPYRVARRRAGTPPARPYRQVREPAPIQRATSSRALPLHAPSPRATVSAMSAPDYSRSLVPFVAMCVAIVVGSLVAVLLLNTTMTQRAYETRDMRTELARLEDQRSELLATIESDASPQALAAAAQGLGMVPAPRVGFVTIESGVVLAPGATG